jgi:hypothetical protein
MAIVASGYLFSDDTAFHVDVFQGDTPCSLMARHSPGSIVKSAAVLDVDVPGQTVPVHLADDEPVVVVGSSPRTSVFVYAESPDEETQPPSDSEGEPSSPLPPPSIPPPPLADDNLTDNSASTPAELIAGAMETIESTKEQDKSEDSKRNGEETEAAPAVVSKPPKFSKTRRVRKLKSKSGTRRASKPLEIELI